MQAANTPRKVAERYLGTEEAAAITHEHAMSEANSARWWHRSIGSTRAAWWA